MDGFEVLLMGFEDDCRRVGAREERLSWIEGVNKIAPGTSSEFDAEFSLQKAITKMLATRDQVLDAVYNMKAVHISDLVVKSAEVIVNTDLKRDAYHERVKADAQILVDSEYEYLEYVTGDSATVWAHPMTGYPFCSVRDGEIRFL